MNARPPAHRAPRQSAILLAALLLALGAIAWGRLAAAPFLVDDHVAVEHDPRIAAGDLLALVTEPWWRDRSDDLLWRPVVSLSFGLNRVLGAAPIAYRVPNLLLHGAVAALHFLLAARLLRSRLAAPPAALLFLVHPVHGSTLGFVVGRADLLAALFALATLLLLAPRRANDEATAAPDLSVARLLLGGFAFALALGSKEHVIALPIALLGLEVASRRRPRLRAHATLIAVALGMILLRVAVLGGLARDASAIARLDNPLAAEGVGLVGRLGTPVALVGRAAGLLAWPDRLSWDYSFAAIEPTTSLLALPVLAGAAVLLLLAALAAWSWSRRGPAIAAVALAAAGWLVVANGPLLIGTIFAERLLYLPAAAFALLLATGLDALLLRPGRATRAGAIAATAAIVIALTLRAQVRAGDFADEATLHARDLRAQPDSARLHASLAAARFGQERDLEALEAADRALAICPEYALAGRIAGLAALRLGRLAEAERRLAAVAGAGGLLDEAAVVALAGIERDRGDFAPAIDRLEAFVARRPDALEARNNLAWYLLVAEPPVADGAARAVGHATIAAGLGPEDPDVLDTLAAALEATGRDAEALAIRARIAALTPR